MSVLGEQGNWRSEVEDVGHLGGWSRSLYLLFLGADCSSQEGSVFAAHRGPFEAWDILPLLDERVALKFVMPEAQLLE